MFRFILMRLGGLVGVLLAVSILTFFLMHLVPGGPFDAMSVATAQMIPQEIVDNLEKLYGLDKPLWTQYWLFLKAAVRGDFGYSYYASGRSVNELIKEHWPYSIQVGLMTLAFSSVVGLTLGIVSAMNPGRWPDFLGTGVSLFCMTVPSFVFAKLMQAGKTFAFDQFPPEIQAAIGEGIADAWGEFAKFKQRVDAGEVGSADAFGTREHLQNNYLYRMAAAVLGIWGNSAAEAIYPSYYIDAEGQQLNGAHRYALRFAPGQLPPVNAFWSLTMYALPESLRVTNPLNRYLLNSTMLDDFGRDEDGGITLYLQHDSPGKEKEPNWLPAPEGPFSAVLRLYWPKAEALDGNWTPPPLRRVG